MLDWTQDSLATRAGVSLKTVQDFEGEWCKPIKVVRASIQQVFEQAGGEFFEQDGLRLRK